MRLHNDFDIWRITAAKGNSNRNSVLFEGLKDEFISPFAICQAHLEFSKFIGFEDIDTSEVKSEIGLKQLNDLR